MKICFHKYQGTGNDFIIIDDRIETFPASKKLIRNLCDRNFGIGADGLILIQNHSELDYTMVYFNSDGSKSLCGNGSRCGFAFSRDLGIVDDSATFKTTDGVHKIKFEEGLIHFQLFDLSDIEKIHDREWFIHTGSPHHIVIKETISEIDVKSLGQEIRYSERYSSLNGANVNFAQLFPDKIKIRTYERGVEDETLSCGTGAAAVGLLAGSLGYNSPVQIETEGGYLKIFFKKLENGYSNIWLTGSAKKVFSGSITI